MSFLASATDPSWLPLALSRFDAVLRDHAHCEKKAAAQALSLLSAFPDRVLLVRRMARLAHEELGHFRQVHDRLTARGLDLGRDPGDPYARALRRLVRHTREDTRLTDLLLVGALIEARSHERLALLAAGLAPALGPAPAGEQSGTGGGAEGPDADLARFYAALAQAEAGHARLFVGLAEEYAPAAAVAERLAEMAAAEAEVLAGLPLAPRIH